MLTRRQLIKTGLSGAVVLGVATYFAAPQADAPPPLPRALQFLGARDALLIMALAPVMLGRPPLPLCAVLQGVDAAIMALPPALQHELRQLLDLLTNPWGRRWLAGVARPWEQASAAQIEGFLRRWQLSRFSMLRSGYQALHALIMAAWYGNPRSWAAIDYRRPAPFSGLF